MHGIRKIENRKRGTLAESTDVFEAMYWSSAKSRKMSKKSLVCKPLTTESKSQIGYAERQGVRIRPVLLLREMHHDTL